MTYCTNHWDRRLEGNPPLRDLWVRLAIPAKKNAKFTFDAVVSNIFADFEEKIFAFDSMNENDFLPRIAKGPADRRRAWLAEFLRGTASSRKTTALKRPLEQNPRS